MLSSYEEVPWPLVKSRNVDCPIILAPASYHTDPASLSVYELKIEDFVVAALRQDDNGGQWRVQNLRE